MDIDKFRFKFQKISRFLTLPFIILVMIVVIIKIVTSIG